MKKTELKHIIKECVKEVLFEEGVLSNLVAEVAFGITKAQAVIAEGSQRNPTKTAPVQSRDQIERREEERKRKLLETKRKVLDAIGNEKMSAAFEGTEPLTSAGDPQNRTSPQSPLAGRDPNDAGIDISKLFSLAGQKWEQLK